MSEKPNLNHNIETVSVAESALAKMKAIEAECRFRPVRVGRNTLIMGTPGMVEEITRQLNQPVFVKS